MSSPKAYSLKRFVSCKLDAIRFFYRFMTCEFILEPEFSIMLKADNLEPDLLLLEPSSMIRFLTGFAEPKLVMVTFTKEDIVSERIFRAWVNVYDPYAIYCVGAFDKEDTKRVTALYFASSNAMVISFPPNWKPTKENVTAVTSLFENL